MQRLLGTDELREALADGRLHPSVLVWKRGMGNWRRAKDIPELMEGVEELDLEDTVTEDRPLNPGLRAEPTPSIPPPEGVPGNMVDIEALRVRAPTDLGNTLQGLGDTGKWSSKRDAHEHPSSAESGASAQGKRRRTERPDPGWKSGAARRDREEETVTSVRREDDPSGEGQEADPSGEVGTFPRVSSQRTATRPWGLEAARSLSRKNSGEGGRPKPSPRSAKTGLRPSPSSTYRSVPTMRPKMQSDALPLRPSSPPPAKKNHSRGSIPPSPKRSEPPPPVKSSAVLSEAFPSSVGKARDDILEEGWSVPPPAREAKGRAPAKTGAARDLPKLVDDDDGDDAVTRHKQGEAEEEPAGKKSFDRSSPAAKRPEPPPAPALAGSRAARSEPPPAPARQARTIQRSVPPPAPKRAQDKPRKEPPPPKKRAGGTPAQAAPRPPVASAEPAPRAAAPGASASLLEQRASAQVTAGETDTSAMSEPAGPPAMARSSALDASAGELDKRLPAVGLAAVGMASDIEPARSARLSASRGLLLGAGLGALVLVVLSFGLGRATAPAQAGLVSAVQARSGLTVVPLFARSRANGEPPRPCLMLRAPARFASSASHRVPFETAVKDEGLLVGYARSAQLPRGMLVEPALGTSETIFEATDELAGPISRVVPLTHEGETRFGVMMREQNDLEEAVYVNAPAPFILGFEAGNLVRRSAPDADSKVLWSLSGKGASNAMRALHLPGKGTAIAYRQGNQIFYGALRPDGSVWHEALSVAGSGGRVGKPDLATDGRKVTVVFADKPPAEGAGIELRWARGTLGEPLLDAAVVELPAGGPGGDAIAPAVASLPGNRWLLMWTEGKPGARTLRAQTYDGAYRQLGEALRVSPATGSFGQGTVAVVGGNAVILFLLATSQSYEVWGTVLQCR